jgi:hypothetical protein
MHANLERNYHRLTAMLVGTAIAIAPFWYLGMTTPGKVVVDKEGKIEGLANVARQWIQGARFWSDQIREIDSEISWLRSAPARGAQLRRKLEAIEREGLQMMEDMYREHPELRSAPPSASELLVKLLRDKADKIESSMLEEQLAGYRRDRIAELGQIMRIVQSRAAGP